MRRDFPISLSALALVLAGSARAQEPGDAPDLLSLDTIVITPTGSPRHALDAPYTVDLVSRELLERRSYRTLPQSLRDVPGVMVQETSHGQGSPFIRGFTGFRTLLTIDGIRLNNSVFRSGPNQYWNTVDPLSIDHVEVVKGPSSVLYGSDAIGGTVSAFTKKPYAWGEDPWAATLFYRGASAENSHQGRAEVSASFGGRTGVLLGGSLKHFGNLEGGEDTGLQPNTGYDEWDGDLVVEHYLDRSTRLVFAHQQVEQDDVPRTHRTAFAVPFEGTDVGSDLQRDLDQRRSLTYLQLHAEDLGGTIDGARASLSWQQQEEVRDRVRGSGARELQGFEAGTLGLWTQFEAPSKAGHWTFGFDWYHDNVNSFLVDLTDPSNPADAIQGPVADDATYDLLGAFVQNEVAVGERTDVVLGARFNYAAVDADSVRDPVTDARISLDDEWSSVVGSGRATHSLGGGWKLFGGVSQGFRAPNLSDLTRFDSARSNEFEVPSPDLDPERYLSWEVGTKAELEDFSTQASLFYVDIEDQILRFPTGDTNASGEFEVAKDNLGDGAIYGVEWGGAWRAAREWTVFGNTTWLDGEVTTFPTSAPVAVDEPPSRLMPWTSQVGVLWEPRERDVWAEAVVHYADDADELSTRDQNDATRIPPGGTPSYTLLSLRAGWRPAERVEVSLGLENVTDEDYRVHGSGQNGPGRNAVFNVRLTL